MYAAELRSAAGLAPRVAGPRARRIVLLARWTRRAPAEAVGRWPWLRDLRPVWWVTRGLVAAWALSGIGTATNVVLVALLTVPVSFWVGEVSPSWSRWPGRGMAVINLLAALLVLPALGWAVDRVS